MDTHMNNSTEQTERPEIEGVALVNGRIRVFYHNRKPTGRVKARRLLKEAGDEDGLHFLAKRIHNLRRQNRTTRAATGPATNGKENG